MGRVVGFEGLQLTVGWAACLGHGAVTGEPDCRGRPASHLDRTAMSHRREPGHEKS
jgi:hypothetical protein